MTARRRPWIGMAGALSLASPAPAFAHSFGMNSIDHYAEIEIGADHVRVRYLLDYAEFAAAPELDTVDADRDEAVTPEERESYLAAKTATILERLRLQIDGAHVPLVVSWRRVAFPPGEAGHSTVRLTWELFANDLALADATHFLVWNDSNHEDHEGWKEIRFLGTGGIGIGSTSLRWNGELSSDGLYPPEVLANPPTDTKAWCRFGVGLEPETHPGYGEFSATPEPRALPQRASRVAFAAGLAALAFALFAWSERA